MTKLTLAFEQLPRRWKLVFRIAITVAILSAIAVAANKLFATTDVRSSLSSSWFYAALVLSIVYRIVNPYGWVLVLRSLGYAASTIPTVQTWLHAESRRWLPGGIWGYASRAVQAEKLGVPVRVASASMLVELLITMLAALLVALAGSLAYREQLMDNLNAWLGGNESSAILIAISIPLVAITLLRDRCSAKLASLTNKLSELCGVSWKPRLLVAAIGYMVAMALLNGAIHATLLQSFPNAPKVPFLVMAAATSAAWITGLLAFFSPGGILVREAALAALLAPWLPYPTAIALAVLSRLAQLVAELIGLLFTLRPMRASLSKPTAASCKQ